MEKPTKQEFVPEKAESFLAEFNAGKAMEITRSMTDLGFGFRRSGSENDKKVVYEGERRNGDGTKITIIIEKGEEYKSPKELSIENEK